MFWVLFIVIFPKFQISLGLHPMHRPSWYWGTSVIFDQRKYNAKIFTPTNFNPHRSLKGKKCPLNKWTNEKTIKSRFLWNGFNNYSFINDLCWYFICLYPGIFKIFGNNLIQDPSMDDRVKLLDRSVWKSRTNFQSRLLMVGMKGKCRVD